MEAPPVPDPTTLDHYVRNLQRRCTATQKGDMWQARLRHYISNYIVIGDEHEGVSQIWLPDNKKNQVTALLTVPTLHDATADHSAYTTWRMERVLWSGLYHES
jgi:hypothetical protein